MPSATKSQLLSSSSLVDCPPRCGHLVNSATGAHKAIALYAFGHELRMTFRTTLISYASSRVVVQLERWGCPIRSSLELEFRMKNTLTTSLFKVRVIPLSRKHSLENTEISEKSEYKCQYSSFVFTKSKIIFVGVVLNTIAKKHLPGVDSSYMRIYYVRYGGL